MLVNIKTVFASLRHPVLYIMCQMLMQTLRLNIYISTLLAISLYFCIYYILNISKQTNTPILKQYRSISFKHVFFYIILAGVLYVAIVGLNSILIDFFPTYDVEIGKLVKEEHPFLMVITLGVFAPIAEEFIFRGQVFNNLIENFGEYTTIFIQAFIFSMMHPIALQQVQTLFIGLVLGFIRSRSKNLLPSTVMHITSNLIACFLALTVL